MLKILYWLCVAKFHIGVLHRVWVKTALVKFPLSSINLLNNSTGCLIVLWFFLNDEKRQKQTLATSAILSFIEKAFDQIYWRKVFQSLCFAGQFSERNKTNRVERNLSPMTALGPKRAGFQPNPSWMTLGRNQIIFVEKMVLFSKKLDDILISRPTFAENTGS